MCINANVCHMSQSNTLSIKSSLVWIALAFILQGNVACLPCTVLVMALIVISDPLALSCSQESFGAGFMPGCMNTVEINNRSPPYTKSKISISPRVLLMGQHAYSC